MSAPRLWIRSSLTGPSSTQAGSPSTVTARALDAYGNTVAAYTGALAFSSSDTNATLPGLYTFTAADAGAHTYTNGVVLKSAGAQWLKATDTARPAISGALSGIVVQAGAVTRLSLEGLASAAAGTAQRPRVTAVDAYGNTVTSYTGTVHFTSSDPNASLPADQALAASDAGTRVFAPGVVLATLGTQWVTVSDAANASLRGSATASWSPPAAPPGWCSPPPWRASRPARPSARCASPCKTPTATPSTAPRPPSGWPGR